jgi:beta-glucanase (GH16 family)
MAQRTWRGGGFVILATLAATAAPKHALAQLVNGGFENGSLSGWTTFNNSIPNVVVESITPRSGSHVAKVFGGYNGNPNYSGLFQNVPASAGQTWQAMAHLRHNSNDPLAGANRIVMKIEFYRVAGGVWGTGDFLGETQVETLSAAAPTGAWTPATVEAVAPVDTVEARIAFVLIQENNAAGAALIDDASLAPGDPPAPIDWELIWSDEFDGPEVDPSKWRIEDLHLIKNNELQYYAPDDAFIEDGKLVLRSRERGYWGFDENGNWRHFDYTSGLVETLGRFGLAYGKIEVCAKLPSTQGLWPAHWTLPTSGAWPPEIDIMELLGHEPTRVYMTHHWGQWPNVQSHGGSFPGPDFSQDFHTFAIEWSPTRIDWSVDGVLRFSSTQAVPQEPFYIILNTAVGGDWPGNPDGTTVFPQSHEIDYVRVYKPADPGDPLEALVDPTARGAQTDGVLGGAEYVAGVRGINAGFFDLIGRDSWVRVDSRADGKLYFAFESQTAWPTPGPFAAVIYVDSIDGAGFASTYELLDTADRPRRLASGKGAAGERADLHFAPGFRADYAIVVEPQRVRIFELGASAHVAVNGAAQGAVVDDLGGNDVRYRIDDGSAGGRVRELRLRLEHLGLAPADAFRFIVTMLNGDTAFRSNEFVGVAAGNPWDTVNPGQTAAVLKPGDFLSFQTAAPPQLAPGELHRVTFP